jgi:bacterioferritin (cytochrome b1)
MTVNDLLNEAKSTCETCRHPAPFAAEDLARSVERWGKRAARAVIGDSRPGMLDVLRRQYAEEIESIVRLKLHAATVRYPQFARRMLEIARQEQRHAQSLVRRIHALGGTVPKVSIDPERRSGWRALTEDLEAEKRCCAELTEALALARDLDPESAGLLEKILAEEGKHLQEITAMQMRMDPQADD